MTWDLLKKNLESTLPRQKKANESRFGEIAKYMLFEIMLSELHFTIYYNPANQTVKS